MLNWFFEDGEEKVTQEEIFQQRVIHTLEKLIWEIKELGVLTNKLSDKINDLDKIAIKEVNRVRQSKKQRLYTISDIDSKKS